MAVLLIGFTLTAGATWTTSRNVSRSREAELDRRINEARTAIESRLRSYTEVLHGLRARFGAGPVSRGDFHQYVTLNDVASRNPGAQALGFVRLVHSADKDAFEIGVRQDTSLDPGYPSFRVHPPSDFEDLFVVDYIEPRAGNEAAVGFDVGTQPDRRVPIEEARDSADLVASGPVRLAQETGDQRGFILFLAVYDRPEIPATGPARRRSLVGLVDAVFRVGDLVSGALGANPTVLTEIYDLGPTVAEPRAPSEDSLLFDADDEHRMLNGGQSHFVDLNVAGRRWRVFAEPSVPLQSAAADSLPWTRAVGGGVITVLLTGLILSFARSRRVALALAHDMTTSLREREAELEVANTNLQGVNESMRDFVAIASHDLRSPLTSVVGFSSLLADNWERIGESERREFVATINRQASHLSRLVDDLLALSGIEGGGLETHPEPIRLHEAVGRCLENNDLNPLELTLDCPQDLQVEVDALHLGRILDNYLLNAFKYGQAPFRFSAVHVEDMVEVRVTDHGPGVPPEFVDRLFGKFARDDTVTTRSIKGTGLGLAIVRGLAEANGGQAWYEPNVPGGACFVVRLPKPDGSRTTPG